MNSLRIAIAGFGFVSRSLVRLVCEDEKALSPSEKNPTGRIAVVALSDSSGWVLPQKPRFSSDELLVLASRKEKGISLSAAAHDGKLCIVPHAGDFASLLAKARPDIFVELGPTDAETGGPSLDRVTAALKARIDVVSASKGPFVVSWEKLMKSAAKGKRLLRFSATVGGGMPILDTFSAFSTANPVTHIECVLNSTSNYVLSLMESDGCSLDDAVEKAREAGIAEADPSKDLDGVDAATKLCILARAIFGEELPLSAVACQSVRDATPEAVREAKENGASLRAIGRLERKSGKVVASVRLERIPFSSPLYRKGLGNAIVCSGGRAGELALLGVGAGPEGTASAVLRDIHCIARARKKARR